MKILLVKTSALGDALHLFPTVTYLRRHFPDARIDWVVENGLRCLVAAHPAIDRVIPVDTKLWRRGQFTGFPRALRRLRHERYDVIYDLQGNIKSGLITRLARGGQKVGFGWRSVAEWPNVLCTSERHTPPKGLNIRDEYLWVVAQHIGKPPAARESTPLRVPSSGQDTVAHLVGRKGTQIAVCPGSAWPNKQLSEETLIDFVSRIGARLRPHFLWVWGTPEERELAERLRSRFPESSVVVPKVSLPTLQHLFWKVDLVIAMDSLALHLAGTTPTPTYSFFGPSNPQKYQPMGNHQHLQGGCPYGRSFDKRCPQLRRCVSGACMKQLPGELCFQTFIAWWQSV